MFALCVQEDDVTQHGDIRLTTLEDEGIDVLYGLQFGSNDDLHRVAVLIMFHFLEVLSCLGYVRHGHTVVEFDLIAITLGIEVRQRVLVHEDHLERSIVGELTRVMNGIGTRVTRRSGYGHYMFVADGLHAVGIAELLASGADIVEMNTVRKRLSGVKGGKFAQACAPAKVFSIVLSDVLGDPLDMIASGPAYPDSSTCAEAKAVVNKYNIRLSDEAEKLLAIETPKSLDNVETHINGSVRELCKAAAKAAEELGYEPVLLTDQLCCEAREAGRFLSSILKAHAGQGKSLAFIAGGETVVHLTGHGLGGRNQELALAAAPGIAGMAGAAVFSVGSDGTDGPCDAAGGYVDGETAKSLIEHSIDVAKIMKDNDAYHALQEVGGLVMTGPTGTNVNDVAVALLRE